MKRFAAGAMLAMLMAVPFAVAKMANVSDEDCVSRAATIVIGKVTAVADSKAKTDAPVADKIITIAVSKTLKGKAADSIELKIIPIARNTIPGVGDEKIFLLTPTGEQGDVSHFDMAVGATMFSVRDVSQEAAIQKMISAQAAEKK